MNLVSVRLGCYKCMHGCPRDPFQDLHQTNSMIKTMFDAMNHIYSCRHGLVRDGARMHTHTC